MIRNIPLNKLRPSPRNVRRGSDEEADRQLKADIEARGLLQNLVVAPARKPKGSYTVEAGGRRLRALLSLLAEGKLEAADEICCFVVEGGGAEASEASLAENFQRLAMNPADECLAFQQLLEQGADVEGIARRFGLTVRFVEGRLRLADLAPVVFEALGAGEITLDIAKAYAATPDRERQAHVFEQVGRSYMSSHPDSIRRMMTQATIPSSDRRARFVGEEAYVAAGGRIERDLFSEEEGERWLDIALLERLATEKLDAVAAEMTASSGLGFVRPTLDHYVGYALTSDLRRVDIQAPPLTEEENAEVEALEAEIEAVAAELDDEEIGEEQADASEARLRELGARLEAIQNRPPVIPDELKPSVGTFLLLDGEGQPRLGGTYYAEPVEEPEPEAATGDRATNPLAARPTEPQRKSASLSQALVDELAMQRRDILSVHVAADPAVALDLAIFLMADREAVHAWGKSGSSLMAMAPSDPVFGFRTPDAAATLARAQAAEALDRSWLEAETREQRFDLFRAIPDDAKRAWLGQAVARTLEASLNLAGSRFCPFHDHLGQLLGIDVAKWWRPTGANYFDRVSKNVALEALAEVGGSALADRYAKVKKAELSQACERIFAGDFIAEVEVKEKAVGWLPEAMRFAPASVDCAADETPPWEDEPAEVSAPDTASDAPSAQAEESGAGEAEAPPAEHEDVEEAA
jgi:ParB family chromosome partitioning protein